MATAAPQRVGGRALFGLCALAVGLLMAIAPPKASAQEVPPVPLDPIVEIRDLIAKLTYCLQFQACGQTVESALNQKLDRALTAFAEGKQGAGCGALGAFINQLNAQFGKDVPSGVGEALIHQAEALDNAVC